MSTAGGGAGIIDVDLPTVWQRLKADPTGVLVDVRTKAEWNFVGVPDLSSISKQTLLIEWQSFPAGEVDPQFAEKLSAQLAKAGVAQDHEIFFICRSGGRSKAAATVMAAKGYSRCRNVADGFEGPLDSQRHRGGAGGWKAAGLPWVQT